MKSAGLVISLIAIASAQTIEDLINDQPVGQQAAPVGNAVDSALGGGVATTDAMTADSNVYSSQAPAPVNAGNAMATLLSSVAGSSAAQHGLSSAAHSTSSQALSEDGVAVVSGLVEAFMHKVALQPGERSCLERNMEQLAGDVMGTVGDIVTAVKALIKGQGTVDKNSTGSMISAGIDSAMKITSLVGLTTQLAKNCVHGDALVMLNKTAHHLINGAYLEHRFIVSGVDIAHSLSDSIISFENKDFHQFGADIGTSLRKMLLSTSNNATRLPEGIPEEVIIQQATDGLMKGFFKQGASMEITDTAHPDIDVVVDLHECIAGNSQFFKELWMTAWDLIAQLSINAEQHGLAGVTEMFQQPQGQAQSKWSGELMVAMMQFPMALTKCNISEEKQSMFMEAIQSLGDLKIKFTMPNSAHIQAAQETKQMAKAVEAWTKFDFEAFGFELGELFRELVMVAFPQKYSIDAAGKLQRLSQIQTTSAEKKVTIAADTVIIGGVAMMVLVAFAVVRTRRSLPNALLERASFTDIENGDAHAQDREALVESQLVE
jgi:hypothetical protein